MNSALRIILLMLSLSVCAHATEISPNEKQVLKSKTMEALFEFCQGRVADERCNKINTELDTLEPEIYFFQNLYKKKVLVIYTLGDFYTHVILLYDNDGLLHVTVRGVLLSHKQEFVNRFLAIGDFIDDDHAE